MAKPSFAIWLNAELSFRDMSMSDLARITGASFSSVSVWISRGVTPSPDTCKRIARALGIPDNEVLMAAGHIESAPITGMPREVIPEVATLLAQFSTQEQRRVLLPLLRVARDLMEPRQ